MKLVNYPDEELKIMAGKVVSIPKFNSQPSTEASAFAQKSSQQKYTDKKSSQKLAKLDERTNVDRPAKHNKQNNKVEPKKQERVEAKAYHIVQKGETLSSISNKYGIDISSLKANNNLKNDKVYPKMKLKIVGIEG